MIELSDLIKIANEVIKEEDKNTKNLLKMRRKDKALILYLVRKLQRVYEEYNLLDEENKYLEAVYTGKIAILSEMLNELLNIKKHKKGG